MLKEYDDLNRSTMPKAIKQDKLIQLETQKQIIAI